MPTQTCVKRFMFCAAHRVVAHENNERNIHGHNFSISITATADAVDAVGRIIDFGCLDAIIGRWIMANWDHAILLWDRDTDLVTAIVNCDAIKVAVVPFNPTSANIAAFLLSWLNQLLASKRYAHVRVVKVVVAETDDRQSEAIDDEWCK